MAVYFPTPASAIAALEAAGHTALDPSGKIPESGTCVAIVYRKAESGDDAYAPQAVTIDQSVHPNGTARIKLTGAVSGDPVHGAAADRRGLPLVYWHPGELQVVPEGDPRAQDQHRDGMPADPFGETPELAAHATDAHELMLVLKAYEGAGFTRAEAFKLVENIHQVELDHAAQHCLVEHQRQGGAHGE